ncbi:MAG: hypothetical protein U5K69_23350 [Balneolaceae bacterium]|nr:hypothetical protein [Balneolaceae bacterium]
MTKYSEDNQVKLPAIDLDELGWETINACDEEGWHPVIIRGMQRYGRSMLRPPIGPWLFLKIDCRTDMIWQNPEKF